MTKLHNMVNKNETNCVPHSDELRSIISPVKKFERRVRSGTVFTAFTGVYSPCYTVYWLNLFWSYKTPDGFVSALGLSFLFSSHRVSGHSLFPSVVYSQADKTLPPMDAEIRACDYDRLNSWCALLPGHDTHVVCINLFLPALTGLKGVSWLDMLKSSLPMAATLWHTI